MTLIYSFANINDVSWGNRPKIEGATSLQAKELAKKDGEIKASYAWYRNKVLFCWLFCTIGHISLFISRLDPVDPVLGGTNKWTIYILITNLAMAVIPTFLDIVWYYTIEYCVWARQRAPPVAEVKVPVSQYVNSNLLGGDIKRKNFAEMEEVQEEGSDIDTQDEVTQEHSINNHKKRMNEIKPN